MSDGKYWANAERVLQKSKEREKTFIGYCTDCKYRRTHAVRPLCVNPLVVLASQNITDDYDSKRIMTTAEQRDKKSVFGPVLCGPDGLLFEPKTGLGKTPLFPWSLLLIPPLVYFLASILP